MSLKKILWSQGKCGFWSKKYVTPNSETLRGISYISGRILIPDERDEPDGNT